MHLPDNGDGTFTNPVMPNAHWSDPGVIRVGTDFYCITSSAETCPVMQILHSFDLVNWDVIGSVARQWYPHLPSGHNWSPRLSYVNGRFRVYFHNGLHGFSVAEAAQAGGPYALLPEHRLSAMHEQWAPSVFEDDDGALYLVASNWIQALDADGLGFRGPRAVVTTGFLENPWLIKRAGWYYWFCSENGTDVWGLLPDKSKVSVWRARQVLGPYEKCPRPLILANLSFQCPNTGSVVLGPDGAWWYLYNTLQVERLTLCRQMHLDRLEWEADGWPVVNGGRGPGRSYAKPLAGPGPRWVPDLNDEFDAPTLEGVDGGVLGRKWLFKREEPAAWSLTERPGWLRLRTLFPSFDNPSPANVLVQRPASAYYALETCLDFTPLAQYQQAGLLVREMQTGEGLAIGLDTTNVTLLRVWHTTPAGTRVVAERPYPASRVYLRIEVEGPVISGRFRAEGEAWQPLGPAYHYAYHSGYFTTFHPGLFAGETQPSNREAWAAFDYFHWEDYEPAGA